MQDIEILVTDTERRMRIKPGRGRTVVIDARTERSSVYVTPLPDISHIVKEIAES